MNREMRRQLAKQMKPMKDPVKEALRVERTTAMTKVIFNQALRMAKEANENLEIIKKSRKFFGAVKGWILHKWR